MSYPPQPKDKQYGDWFPNIPVRPVPSPPGHQTIKQSSMAMQPDSSSSGRSAEVLSLPKRIEFGALRLWVSGAGRDSLSFDDGPDFDTKAHGIAFVEDPDDAKPFCIAPGTDEKAVTIRWHVHGLQYIKSAKLELFCRGHQEPIWEHHWGNAWGKKHEEIAAFPVNRSLSTANTIFCEYPFSKVEVKKDLKVKNDEGADVAAFAKGFLTLDRSPYQLRQTVSGCSATGLPPDGDRYAYPMVAWTYLHVLLHSITLRVGEAAWLSDQRPDIDDAFREKVIGTRKDKGDGKGVDYGWEGDILAELKKSSTSLKAGAYNRIRLRSTLINSQVRKKKGDTKSPLYLDYERYAMMWGLGPRIPLVARPSLRACDQSATEENVAAVCAGARLLWDWVDDESVPEPRWLAATRTPTLYDGKKTRDFLTSVYKRSSALEPKGSYNCPAVSGGKLGGTDPIFLEQATPATGPGGLPFEVRPCTNRKWAAVSAFNDKGETGVMFNPSRMAGDCYTVNVYPFTKELDSTAAIDPASLPCGSTGKLEIFRQVKVYHLVVGDLPGVDVRAVMATVNARMASQTSMEFLVEPVYLFENAKKYSDLIEAMLDAQIKRVKSYVTVHLPLTYKPTVLLGKLPGPQFVRIRSRAEYNGVLREMFKDGTLRAVLEQPLASQSKGIRDGKKPTETEASETARAFENESLIADGGALAYALHQKSPLIEEDEDDKGNTTKREVRPGLRFLLTKKGSPPFASGSEQAKGECTGIKRKLDFYQNARSCLGREFQGATSTAEGTITVTFPSVPPVTVKYAKQGFTRQLKDTLAPAELDKLRQKLRDAGKTFDESKKMTIQIQARENSDNSRRRVTNLKASIDAMFDQEFIVLDRLKIAEEFLTGGSLDYALTPKTFAADWTKSIPFLESFADAFIEKEKVEEGLLVAHFNRISQIADTPDSKGVYGAAKLDWKDMMFGSNDPLYRTDNEFIGLVKLQAPDPNGANTDKQTPMKTPESVLIHEIGHALFLSDHALMLPERVANKMGTLVGADVTKHVELDPCLMDYDKDTNQFCGLCMLRLRGWKWDAFDNKGGSQFAQVAFEIGDVDDLFDAGPGTWEGFAARLQVLNLFNRPLRMGRQSNDHPVRKDYDHFTQCAKFSIAHAAKLLGDGILATDTDPGRTPKDLAKAIREFIVEGGSAGLDGEVKPMAKLRVFGGVMPLFSNSDMELRCRQTGEELFADQPEEEYGLGADRAAVEAQYFEDNYALGSIPISIKVTDSGGAPLSNLRVWVSLVDPNVPADDYAQEKSPVPGGASFTKGCRAPAPHTDPAAFLKQHVVDAFPGADGDPQKANVAYALGGKRGLAAAGDVTSPGPKGERNILIGVDGSALPRALDTGGVAVANTVEVMTDSNGRADFHFCPSRIGGDAYRLRAEVLDPAIPGGGAIASKETGALVVWRTVRISRHVQMPGVADVAELPKPLTKYLEAAGRKAEELVKPLATLDLKHLAREFAKAYLDVIFEPAADKPEDLAPTHWGAFMEKLRAIQREYPEVVNTTTWLDTGRKPGINDAFHIPLKQKSKTVYQGKFPPDVIPDSVYLVAGAAGSGGANMRQAIAHDYFADRGPLQGRRGPLVELKAGDKISGRDDKTKQGGVLAIEADIAQSWVDYETGEVQVTFKTEPPSKDWTAGGHLKSLFNLDALLAFPAKSPFVFNLRPPKEYNQYVRSGGFTIEEGRPGIGAREISKKSWGLPLGMIKALHQSLGDNGQSYYPGLVIMHANSLDLYSYVCGEALQGKGTGNGVILYTGLCDDASRKNLMVHEAAHCLYMMHNFGPASYMKRHDVANNHRCVMSYDKPSDQHGGFCGKCLASLRGMPVVEGPLKDKGFGNTPPPVVNTPPPTTPPPTAVATYVMLSSTENANADAGKYHASIPTAKQHLVMVPDLATAKQSLTAMNFDPVLDLFVLNQAHGEIGEFTAAHWSGPQLKANLVQPLLDKGVKAKIIVLDFCVSASLLETFIDLCSDDGRIISNMYSLTSLVVDTDRWGRIKDDLVARNLPGVWTSLEARMKELNAIADGMANAEVLRQGPHLHNFTELQITQLLSRSPQVKDYVSIIRYLKLIYAAFNGQEETLHKAGQSQTQDLAAIFDDLKAVKENPNLGDKEKALLQPLPALASLCNSALYLQMRKSLKDRMIEVAHDPNCGINDTRDLSATGLFPYEDPVGIGNLVWSHDKEILAQARGLPICPSVFAVYSKSTQSFTLDSELKIPLSDPIGNALDQVHPLSRTDIDDILRILHGVTLDPQPNYLQPT